jgi:hypothetical protein
MIELKIVGGNSHPKAGSLQLGSRTVAVQIESTVCQVPFLIVRPCCSFPNIAGYVIESAFARPSAHAGFAARPRADVDLGHAACLHVRACRPIERDPEKHALRLDPRVATGFFAGQTRSVCPQVMPNSSGSDGGAPATPCGSARGMRRREMRPPSD